MVKGCTRLDHFENEDIRRERINTKLDNPFGYKTSDTKGWSWKVMLEQACVSVPWSEEELYCI